MGIKFNAISYEYLGFDESIVKALIDVNLNIASNHEFIALVGETGSGKSTLVKHMNALMIPTSGTSILFDIELNQTTIKDNKTKKNPIRKQVGLVFQFPEYQLFEETVLKDVAFGPQNFNVSLEDAIEKAKTALKLVGLDETYYERSPFHLSGGEKKRVSIAGILAMEPDILVLDEPTSGLDPMGQYELMEVFKTIQEKQNISIVFISHDMNWVYAYANRVLVMHQGCLVYDGDKTTFFNHPQLLDWKLEKPDNMKVFEWIKDKPLGRQDDKLNQTLKAYIKGDLS